jgi:hypothetical protein
MGSFYPKDGTSLSGPVCGSRALKELLTTSASIDIGKRLDFLGFLTVLYTNSMDITFGARHKGEAVGV